MLPFQFLYIFIILSSEQSGPKVEGPLRQMKARGRVILILKAGARNWLGAASLRVVEKFTSQSEKADILHRDLDAVQSPLLDLDVLSRHSRHFATEECWISRGHGGRRHVYVQIDSQH